MANPFPWQNKANSLDARNAGIVVPLDALLVINELNRHTITDAMGSLPKTLPPGSSLPYFDVNGDDFVSPIDSLRIISKLNEPAGGAGEGEEPLNTVFQPDQQGKTPADRKLSSTVFI